MIFVLNSNIKKLFQRLILFSCSVLGFIFLPSHADAQFMGFKIDTAIAYSASQGSVSGGAFGIIHPVPFFPNIGYSSVKFEDKQEVTDPNESTSSVILTTDTTINTFNFFYYVPFPVVTISVGIGLGQDNLNTGMEAQTIIEETYQNSKQTPDSSTLKTSVSETFLHIGLPFWNTIEFHLGYHLMSVKKIDLTSKKNTSLKGSYDIVKKNYTGGMTTVGVQIAF